MIAQPSSRPVTVDFATIDGTAIAVTDYVARSGSLNFAPGETIQTIAIDINADNVAEPDETFTLRLSNASNASIEDPTALGTILGITPTLSISDATSSEPRTGTAAMAFIVSLSRASSLPVTVDFATIDGTALAGTDYVARNGSLNFAPGEITKTIAIDINAGDGTEPNETFSVVLVEAANAALNDFAGMGTILSATVPVSLLGKRTATFTDVDGDQVKVKIHRGKLALEDFTMVPAGEGFQLARLDLSNVSGAANVSIAARKVSGNSGGDGHVDVGYIDARHSNLGSVFVDGDLGQIDCGVGSLNKPALRRLDVESLGGRGLSTQAAELSPSLHSEIFGDVRTVVVNGDIASGVTLACDANAGKVRIRGDVVNGTLVVIGRSPSAASPTMLAIDRIDVDGNVTDSQIVGQGDDARIGTVRVGGNWTASDLVAGVSTGPDGYFGTADDVRKPGGPNFVSTIASIIIKGIATGTSLTSDHFGWVAEKIVTCKIGATKVSLTPGAGNDLEGISFGATNDLTLREVTTS